MKKSIESSQNLSSSALLQGQVVLITGASRGIGAATALLLALPDQQLPGCWWWQLLALMLMRRSAHFTRFF